MSLLKKRYWVIITLLLTLFLVLRAFPATWVIYGVQQAAPGLQVSGVSGSLWSGQADYSQWVDRGHTLPLGELKWSLQGLSLLTLNPCVNFSTQTNQQAIKGQACYALIGGAAKIEEVDASVPVGKVAPFFSVDLDGNIDAYVKQAIWQDQQLGKTDINLLWQRASLYNGNQWIPLGDIQSRISDDGNGGVVSQWNNVESARKPSPVALNLNAGVTALASAKPVLKVTGTVTPGPRATALQQMLQFVGEPTGNGAYRIDVTE